MKIFRKSQYLDPVPSFEDLFGESYLDDVREKLRHQVIGDPSFRSTMINLYRGFDHLPELINGKYTFTPERSEQGVLWFTHDFIRGYNGLEYARNHGKYLLTYPLEAIKHYQLVSYDNSDDSYEKIPDEIYSLSDGLENCRYYLGYELPEGWYFSYKMEKFIICDHELTVDVKAVGN